MCLYPKLIKNPKYKATKKNGGNIPPIKDDRVTWVPIGCQQCIECRKQKARSWQVRLLEDLKEHKNGKFITLTFSNQSYTALSNDIKDLDGHDRENAIATLATRRFLERWRKQHGKSVRHWLVTELGHNGTENIHIHGIIWTDKPISEIENHWQYGFVWKGKMINGKLINYVNERTVNYIVKYVHKVDLHYKTYKSMILTSPGIGRNYTTSHDSKLNAYNNNKTIETYRTRTGHKIALPIYWRNKIYNEQQREQLWLQKLDKQVRWVCGQKVDISKTEEHYYKLLAWHQERNKRLGYGDDTKDWKRAYYERQRRNALHKARTMPSAIGEDSPNPPHKVRIKLGAKTAPHTHNAPGKPGALHKIGTGSWIMTNTGLQRLN